MPRENGNPLNRCAVNRKLNRIAHDAGIGHVHPHQLRHTLATQAINRGMSIEAIAALLAHRSLDLTRRLARIVRYGVRTIGTSDMSHVAPQWPDHDDQCPALFAWGAVC